MVGAPHTTPGFLVEKVSREEKEKGNDKNSTAGAAGS
jgi:hypothetical protein